jgi:hypothetical protein
MKNILVMGINQLQETFVLNIQFGGRPSILQGVCIMKNILVTGISLSLRVIELHKKNGSDSAIFETVAENFCAKYSIWRPAVNPRGRLHHEKYFSHGHKPLAPDNRVA